MFGKVHPTPAVSKWIHVILERALEILGPFKSITNYNTNLLIRQFMHGLSWGSIRFYRMGAHVGPHERCPQWEAIMGRHLIRSMYTEKKKKPTL